MPKKLKSKNNKNKNKNKNSNKNKNNIVVNVNSNNRKKVSNSKKQPIQPSSSPIVISHAPPQQLSNPYILDHIHQNNTNGLGVQKLIDSIGGLTRIQAQQQNDIQQLNVKAERIKFFENAIKNDNLFKKDDYVMVEPHSQRGDNMTKENVLDDNVSLLSVSPSDINYKYPDSDDDYDSITFLDSIKENNLKPLQDDVTSFNGNLFSPSNLNLMGGTAGLTTHLTKTEKYLPSFNPIAETHDLMKVKPTIRDDIMEENIGNIYNTRSKKDDFFVNNNPLNRNNWGGQRVNSGRISNDEKNATKNHETKIKQKVFNAFKVGNLKKN